ncbi:CRISPR-associated protein Cse1 [Acidiphilium sp.]|uniref:CRISPR-associated protein Cse1 n=1 Tax=Acidiphilium sp. TaxID=527 RepID=UPI002585EDD4|nr:CRISPR-associated protein Cse1 [Acidiphilium sp.]
MRDLTPGFAADEPWQLVVEDWTQPAFLQPPVPDGVTLANPVPTPDALDLLITSKNHDLKQAVARQGQPEDWLFALVSLQTSGIYSKAGRDRNYWNAVRTGNIYAPRVLVGLAPLPKADAGMSPRLGAWFRRDVTALLETRASELEQNEFYAENGIGLTWLAPWPEGEQFQLNDRAPHLDIWFIEVCRRLRLQMTGEAITAKMTGTEKGRINGGVLGGKIGDPWTPIPKDPEKKALSLASKGFDYRVLTKVLFGETDAHDWILPVLAKPLQTDDETQTFFLVAQGVAAERKKNGTLGFHSRILPIAGKVSRALGPRREQLHELAKAQTKTIAVFDKAIGNSLALAAARGEREKRKKDHYTYAIEARNRFDRAVDGMFSEHLWDRLEAQDKGREALEAARLRWARTLYDFAKTAFETALPAIPCAGVFRPRAEARARRAFYGTIRSQYPELFDQPEREEAGHAA